LAWTVDRFENVVDDKDHRGWRRGEEEEGGRREKERELGCRLLRASKRRD
jgi:hypothetical protein